MEYGDDLDGVRQRAEEDGMGESLNQGAPKSMSRRTVGLRVTGNPADGGVEGEMMTGVFTGGIAARARSPRVPPEASRRNPARRDDA